MAPERKPGGFGGRLREARERRGVSLRQIANATKISIGALEALERNDISRLPGGIFSRAFVRSYAVEVGLDPEETIRDFIAQFPHDSVTAGHPASKQIEDTEALESDRRMASAFLRLLVISLPIVGVVLYFTAGRAAPGLEEELLFPQPADSLREQPPTDVALSPGSLPDAAPVSLVDKPLIGSAGTSQAAASQVGTGTSDLLRVGVSATGPCWVSAVVDGRPTLERLFQPGERELLEVRHELVLTTYDAAALSLTFNGAAARPLGKPGEMVTRRVNLTNFRDYLAGQ